MILAYDDYRSFLKAEMAERKQKNPAYSMRSFARNVGLTQSAISQVLAGKKNLSADSAQRIGAWLGLRESEAEYLQLLVQLEIVRMPALRTAILARLQSFRKLSRREELDLESFRTIADWHHLTIRNMAEIAKFKFTPANVARRLGISRLEAEVAIDRLQRLDLIAPDPARPGQFRKTKNSVVFRSGSPNEALRAFHRQMLAKASDAVERQSPQEKLIGSETIAIARENLPAVEQMMESFFQKVLEIEERSEGKTDVYHLGVQFFNLTPMPSTTRVR